MMFRYRGLERRRTPMCSALNLVLTAASLAMVAVFVLSLWQVIPLLQMCQCISVLPLL
jgi:hypothetical protein